MSAPPNGRVGGASARGASHVASGKPNQDSVGWRRSQFWSFIAVADGHGASPHRRSDRGSRFAVEAALAVLEEAVEAGATNDPEALTAQIARLGETLVTRWRDRVDADVAGDPVPEAPGFARRSVYGSTCVGAAIGPGAALLMQIGDGDIYLGAAERAIVEAFPRDDTFGEETYSLCLDDAARHVKVALLRAPNPFSAPDFVFASTDGFSKSFANPASARDVVDRTRQATRDKGFDAALADLPRWLAQCAGAGAGDDVSVMLFWSAPTPAAAGEDIGATVAPEQQA